MRMSQGEMHAMKNSTITTGFVAVLMSASAQAVLIVPTGLAPGETYQLAFVTSGTTAATSGNIADYNALVQAAADAANMGIGMGITWNVIGSTASVNANANALVSTKVFNMNGELVALNYADFWDGTHTTGIGIDYDENNAARNFNVWTGSNADGTAAGVNALGNASVRWGESTFSSSGWISHGNQVSSVSYSLYALSSTLTAPVPVPAAAWLFASGMLALAGLSRRFPA